MTYLEAIKATASAPEPCYFCRRTEWPEDRLVGLTLDGIPLLHEGPWTDRGELYLLSKEDRTAQDWEVIRDKPWRRK